MRLVRRHGKAMLLHQRWKLGAAMLVGVALIAAVSVAELHSRYMGLPSGHLIASQESDPDRSRRLFYPSNDAVIRRYDRDQNLDDNGYYINAPPARKLGIVIHIIGIVYMLVGLNTVCDIFFCGALDEMVEKWNVKPDVAGATFMAAGGSAPELFASLIGAITESDVGFGTIVGSAVFNVLAVIGCCGMVAQEPIKLTWWPLFRDCTYYIFSLCLLAGFAYGEKSKGGSKIELYEAIILFLAYLSYCIIMVFNEKLEATVQGFVGRFSGGSQTTKVTPVEDNQTVDLKNAAEGDAAPGPPEHHVAMSGDQANAKPSTEACQNNASKPPCAAHAILISSTTGHHISEKHVRRVHHKAHAVHHHAHTHEYAGKLEKRKSQDVFVPELTKVDEDAVTDRVSDIKDEVEVLPDVEKPTEAKESGEDKAETDSIETDDVEALIQVPDGSTADKLAWALCLPIYGPLYYCVPKPGPKYFMVTFFLSLVFIGFYSYFLVYCVQMFGYAILNGERSAGVNIVLSFTVLAAGTSIPDLVSSMAVAREGEGDMAVSSSIGSNIFDILVGLPVPWIIKIGIVEMGIEGNSNYAIGINSPYIALYVFLLLFMVACVIISIMINKWYLNKALGIMMSVLYIVFLAIVLPVELTGPDL